MQKNVCTLQVLDRAARPRPHFCTTGSALITRNCYTKLCAIYWSPYHGSSAKLVLYSLMASAVCTLMPRSLRYWRKTYRCYVTKTFPPFQPRI